MDKITEGRVEKRDFRAPALCKIGPDMQCGFCDKTECKFQWDFVGISPDLDKMTPENRGVYDRALASNGKARY